MKAILISACLLGVRCRYDGQSRPLPGLSVKQDGYYFIPVCPEILGGLPTPRLPAERVGERVLRQDGADMTDAYIRGAKEVLRLAELYHAYTAILKERSPSCGNGSVYDGSFSGTLTNSDGVTAALLKAHGIRVIGESAWESVL